MFLVQQGNMRSFHMYTCIATSYSAVFLSANLYYIPCTICHNSALWFRFHLKKLCACLFNLTYSNVSKCIFSGIQSLLQSDHLQLCIYACEETPLLHGDCYVNQLTTYFLNSDVMLPHCFGSVLFFSFDPLCNDLYSLQLDILTPRIYYQKEDVSQ